MSVETILSAYARTRARAHTHTQAPDCKKKHLIYTQFKTGSKLTLNGKHGYSFEKRSVLRFELNESEETDVGGVTMQPPSVV